MDNSLSPLLHIGDDSLLNIFSFPEAHDTVNTVKVQPKHYPRGRPEVSSGFLDTLPLELVDKIFSYLDCESLNKLIATNSHLESYIRSLPSYKLVVENCQSILHAMKTSAFSRRYTIGDIYDAFRNPHCSECSDFGTWFFLPKLKRCCRNCLGSKEALKTVLIEEVMGCLGLTFMEAINLFPFYAQGAWTYLCLSDVLEFVRKYRIQTELPTANVSDTAVRIPIVIPESGMIDFGRHCMPCALSAQEQYPGVDLQSPHTVETAIPEGELRHRIFRVYSPQGLLGHIRSGECETALEYWNGTANLGHPLFVLDII